MQTSRWRSRTFVLGAAAGAALAATVLAAAAPEMFAPGRLAWLAAPAEAATLGPAPYDRDRGRRLLQEKGEALVPQLQLSLLAPRSAVELERQFRRSGLSLEAVAEGDAPVPRLYVLGLPSDLGQLDSAEKRKSLFLGAVLPLVLLANEEVREQRARLLALRSLFDAGETLTVTDAAWLAALALHYRLEQEDDLDELVLRVAEVPVSLALAQAVVESGWGTSSLARDGNALFGQRAWGEDALVLPVGDGRREGFRSFDDLMGSVRAYLHNLNTHDRYRSFRARRAEMLAAGEPLDGLGLVATLERYAEAEDYAGFLRSVIRGNRLQEFEGARLESGLLTADRPAVDRAPEG